MAIPFLMVGDAPGQPTGLSRILGDLATRIADTFPELDVRTCGYVPWSGLPTQGTEVEPPPGDIPPMLPRWVFNDVRQDWGASAVVASYRKWWGNTPGVMMSVWDPGRCHAFQKLPLPVEKWGYFAVDAENIHGTLSGPAAEGVKAYDRVLAYNAYGAQVLQPLVAITEELTHLPHGLEEAFHPGAHVRPGLFRSIPPDRQIVGSVATNQSRKDWGMVMGAMRVLLDGGRNVHLWAHVNTLVAEAWSIPQLVEDFQLEDRITLTTGNLPDTLLAACYAHSDIHIAPGRGEGHGYPIVEALACGTPVVHVWYAGGADILKAEAPEWLIPYTAMHLVGPYALQRPILDPRHVANLVGDILDGSPKDRRQLAAQIGQAYYWPRIWPQWAEWVRCGLEEIGT